MKNKTKRNIQIKAGFEIKQVSAFINGIKHIFTRDRIFTDIGVEIK